MSESMKALSTQPWALDTDIVDNFGLIEPLAPKVLARARRVVTLTHGTHPLKELLDILGLTEVQS